jgi:hypothetical protein
MQSTTLVTRLALLVALGVAALALSGTASALPPCCRDNPPPPPPPPPPRPNLVVTEGAVTAIGVDQWEVRYTVRNAGNATASAFYVDTHQDGSALLRSSYQGSLAAGASRSETMTFARTSNCYLAVRFTADSRSSVSESSEGDNTRWSVGQTGPDCATLPRYQVKAVSFYAADETGTDWLGSDEPYWIFNSEGMDGTAHSTASHEFGDIDTGDTGWFGSIEGCIYLHCSGGTAPNGIGISIQLMEADLGYSNQTLAVLSEHFADLARAYPLSEAEWLYDAFSKVEDVLAWINSWAADDLVGTQTFNYSPTYLASRLPAVGGSFTDTRTYTGGGGRYTMTVRTTRVG